ncbi:peptidase [Lysinibacillus sp. GbtcB16]|uniref:peptidase n=1 Tax=Lysinibacillus sp. GbtcB16 TaxID=2824761 RepID=UPI001C3040C3|nr:peptidase [Lysinibacillus sp. GbtcB16]
MGKLILKTSNLYSLNDSENVDLGEICFDISQFKVPTAMVVQKDGFATRIEKEKNLNGELVETGKYTLTFKVYDRPFIELILQNGGTEIGSPIMVVVENQESLPIFDNYEDGEFISIAFKGLKIKPKKVQKKAFVGQGKPMVDTWQYLEIKIEADSYAIGEVVNEPKAK